MSTRAYFFPGQGSQAVGMGRALHERYEVAREVFAEVDDALGFSLSTLCFEGPADELTLTANTQPAILTTSIAALRVLESETDASASMALGHSLGEFSALVAAGALELADAARLVRLRGQAMQEAVPAGQGAMAAIMGLATEELEPLCEEAAQGQVCSPANENGGGQIVVAGHTEAVARLVSLAKSRKARAIPLRVSAPFHCALMQPAAERLEEALAGITLAPMRIPVIANVTAELNDDPSRVRSLLVRQVTHRVRWEASVQAAARHGVNGGLEVGHGKVLTGLVKRITQEIGMSGVGSPDDIDVLKGGSDDDR
jgi:[acyl-carrier-protein] S-malonyltransferase